ncbi:hypothetical protein ACAG96_03385 [Candidatus Izemoplasma sp. B36]|uniref:TPR end-of-group domain-containing protein n=1 Tax=Candidatus Izemoplasma sp. B36 TaxID=3242468 RepID=UPI0035576518
MSEENILNNALDLLDSKGLESAYEFLINNKLNFSLLLSQYYNYIYCLASLLNKKEESLKWMKEAIIDLDMWYRPEVFEDEDLDNVRNYPDFRKFTDISYKKYKLAERNTKIVSTWKKADKDFLLIVFHGNQQNNEVSRFYWESLNDDQYQVEYIQSNEIDSYNLFRWNDETSDYTELFNELNKIKTNTYKKVILVGFSSGCNVILKTVLNSIFKIDQIILHSPWIPTFIENSKPFIDILQKKGISIFTLCGDLDEDTFEHYTKFVETINKTTLNITYKTLKNLKHEISDESLDLIVKDLKGN